MKAETKIVTSLGKCIGDLRIMIFDDEKKKNYIIGESEDDNAAIAKLIKVHPEYLIDGLVAFQDDIKDAFLAVQEDMIDLFEKMEKQ